MMKFPALFKHRLMEIVPLCDGLGGLKFRWNTSQGYRDIGF